ncbi:MAG: amidohydrolase family protein [Rariglobus sp.]
MSKTDWHSHFIPPAFADYLRSRSTPPRIFTKDGGELIQTVKEPAPYHPDAISDVAARLKSLDAAGIDRQVFSWPGVDSLPLAEAVVIAREFNNAAAALIAEHPERFSAVASLPLADAELAARELERAHELGLIGAVLPSEAFASLEAAQRLTPLFKVAQERKSHLFIHPRFVSPVGEPEPLPLEIDQRGARLGGLEVQARVGNAFFTVALTDLLVPYPDIVVHLVNLGGTIPFLAERLDIFSARHGLGSVFERLRRVYVDTANMGPRTIAFAASILGADRIVFGSDQPISTPLRTVEQLNASPITEEQRRTILENPAGRPERDWAVNPLVLN